MIVRLWKTFAWLGVAAALVLSLIPPFMNEAGHTDKIVHMTGYAVMMFWWAQLVVRRRWQLAMAIVLFGAAIELLQGLTPDRDPDVFDALANSAGVLLGWLAARLLPNIPDTLGKLYRPRSKRGYNPPHWGGSSAGRASRSQCEGREFDPPPLHQQIIQRSPSKVSRRP